MISVNKKAQTLVDDLILNKSYYRVDVSKGHKNVTIIDAGINALGNIEAGRIYVNCKRPFRCLESI